MDEKIDIVLKVHKMVMDNHRARLILLEQLLLKGPEASSQYFGAVKALEGYLLLRTDDGNSGSGALSVAERTRLLDSFVSELAASLQVSIDQARPAKDLRQ